ncbi:MAG: hypothetical protein M1129_04225 [Candidatus Thermoplasmatota archaeon]|jgi:hypothetical protein|nr:hypothetical protein [Candidatus Thermoplasmatota archaeon]
MARKTEMDKTYGTWTILPEGITVECRLDPDFRFFTLLEVLWKYGYVMTQEKEREALDRGEIPERDLKPFTLSSKGFDPLLAVSDHYKNYENMISYDREGWKRLGYSTPSEVAFMILTEDLRWIKKHLERNHSNGSGARGTNPRSLDNLKKSSKRKGDKGKKGNN